MQTFLLDLRGQAGFGPATPLLYPLLAAGQLVRVPPSVSLGGSAEAVGVRLRRAFVPRWRPLVLTWLRPGDDGLAQQLAALDEHLLEPLAAQGLSASEALLVTFDVVAREPLTGRPVVKEAEAAWEHDREALPERLRDGARVPTTVVRVPFQTAPEPRYQQDLLRVVFLLAALLREDELPVPRRVGYRVQEVALDAATVGRWMQGYAAHLRAAQEAVAQRLNRAPQRRVPLYRDVACGCTGTLPDFEAREEAFGWLQGREDRRRWVRWGRNTGEELAGLEGEEAALLARCRTERRTRPPRPAEEDVEDLGAALAAARKELDQARRGLLEETQVEGGVDWEEDFRARTPPVVEVMAARPRTRALAVSAGVTFAGAVLPVLLALPGASTQDHLVWAGSLAGGVLLLTVLLLGVLAVRLRRRIHAVAEWAEELASRLRRRLERRQRHLGRLCELEATRYNLESLQAAREEAGLERERLLYHQAALAEHLADAEAIARAASVGTQLPAVPLGHLPAIPPSWPSHLPPLRHPTYLPAMHPPSPRGADEYELRVGASAEKRPTEGIYGLLRIHLERDGSSAEGGRGA